MSLTIQNNTLTRSQPIQLQFSAFMGHLYKTFDSLPENHKIFTAVNRIILVVASIIIVPVLGLLALGESLVGRTKIQSTPPLSAPSTSAPQAYRQIPYQIPHESRIAFEGYSTKELIETQILMELREIPLHVCPKRPSKDIQVVNYEALERYIARLPANFQQTFRKVWDTNFLHITMQMFDDALKQCLEQLNTEITHKIYAVGFATGKSSQWVASLALKNLTTPPSTWITLGYQNTNPVSGYDIDTPREQLTLPEDPSMPIVLFDDCAYSGTQLVETIHAIEKKSDESRTIYLVVPFVSNPAMKKLEQLKADSHLNLQIIVGSQRIRNAGDDLVIEERRAFHKLVPTIAFTCQIGSYLTVTDWRIPDNMPLGFGRWAMKVPEDETDMELKGQDAFIERTDIVKRPYAFVTGD